MIPFTFWISPLYLDWFSSIVHWCFASGVLILLAFSVDRSATVQHVTDRFFLWKAALIGTLGFPVLFAYLPAWVNPSLVVSDLSAYLSWYHILFWVYLGGFSIRATLLLLRLKDQRLLLRSSRECTMDWITQAVHELSQSLNIRQKIRIRISTAPGSPFVIGLLRPTVVLPEAVLRQFSKNEIRLMLAHELSHVHHHDMVYERLISLLQIMLWFFPGGYILKRGFEHRREPVCDWHAIQLCRQPQAYANMFVHLSESLLPQPVEECDLSLMRKGRHTLERFDLILRHGKHPAPSPSPLFRYSLITLVTLLTVLMSGVRISLTQQTEFPSLDETETLVLEVDIPNRTYPMLPPPNPVTMQTGILPVASYSIQLGEVYWIVDHPDTLTGFPVLNRGVASEPIGELALTPIVAEQTGGRTTSPRAFSLTARKDSFLIFDSIDRGAPREENPQPLGGIHVVDVSNPAAPQLVNQISAVSAGGINIIGDTLFARISEDVGTLFVPNFLVALDITIPAQMLEKWRIPLPNNEFFFSADVHPSDPSLLYLGGRDIFVYRLEADGATLLARWEFERRNFSVLKLKAFETGLFCVTQSRPEGFEVNQSQTVEHRWLELSSPVTPGRMTSLPFPNDAAGQTVHIQTLVDVPYFITTVFFRNNRSNDGILISRLDNGSALTPAAFFPLGHGLLPTAQVNREVWLGGDPLWVYSLESLIPTASITNFQNLEDKHELTTD